MNISNKLNNKYKGQFYKRNFFIIANLYCLKLY